MNRPTWRLRPPQIALAALLPIVAAVSWWVLARQQDAGAAAPRTARIVRRDFTSSVLATGAVKPQIGSEVRVGARVSGRVVRLYANIGDPIRKGRVIAELEKDELQARVDRNRAELAVAEARVEDAEARLKLADLRYRRQSALIAGDFTSQDAVDNAAKELTGSQAGLVLAKRQVESARAALRESEVDLGYATITAPISGVIASVSTQEGETVAAGLNAPVFVTIVDLARLQVDAFVDEVDIGRIRVGQAARFTVDSYPAVEFEGRVSAVYPSAVIQDNVVNYDVVVDITSPYEGRLRPDMTASITIVPEARPGVLAVPTGALRRERGKSVLGISTSGRVEMREVKTGLKDGSWVEIVAGAEEGQIVVLPDSLQAGGRRGGP